MPISRISKNKNYSEDKILRFPSISFFLVFLQHYYLNVTSGKKVSLPITAFDLQMSFLRWSLVSWLERINKNFINKYMRAKISFEIRPEEITKLFCFLLLIQVELYICTLVITRLIIRFARIDYVRESEMSDK